MRKIFLYFTLFIFCILTFTSCKSAPKNNIVYIDSYKITSDFGERIEEPEKPANYIPIPKELSLQYKAEMEQIMLDELPNVIKKADDAVLEAKKLRDNIMKNGYNESEAYNIQLIQDGEIPAASLGLYTKMMQITQEKYLKIPYTPIGTDHPNAIYYYLYPYFKDNKISFNTLDKINDLIDERYYFIENFINDAKNLYRHNNSAK